MNGGVISEGGGKGGRQEPQSIGMVNYSWDHKVSAKSFLTLGMLLGSFQIDVEINVKSKQSNTKLLY